MSILHQLMAKPWVPTQAMVDDFHVGGTFALSKATLGLRVLLAAITVLFALLIFAYGMRMELEVWRPSPQMSLLWLNTVLLVLSSLAMQWSLFSARRHEIDGVWIGLLASGFFAIAFLGGQIMAWRQLNSLAAFNITNPAIGFYYLITAMHGLHLLGGLVALGRTTSKVWRGFDVALVRQSVELCTTYWHYLLLIWLVLFGLLFSGNDSLGILLSICGLR